MRPETLQRLPALILAALLHAGVIAAILLFGSLFNKPVFGPTVVPVTLMRGADIPAPGIPAPEPTPTVAPPTPPAPQAPPQPTPTPPAPVPSPAPAKSMPTPPKPSPKAATTAPSKTPTQTAPDDDAFLNNLSKDLAHGGKPAASAPHPSARPNPSTGTAPSAAALADLGDTLNRLWNPNCDVMGGGDVNITVSFVLGAGGRVIGQPTSSGDASTDPIVKVAADRAIRAVNQAPMAGFPPDRYRINFDSKKACKSR